MSYFKKSKKPSPSFGKAPEPKKVEKPKVKCKFHKQHDRHCLHCNK